MIIILLCKIAVKKFAEVLLVSNLYQDSFA